MALSIELIWDAAASLGEGPLWDVREERLYWIDSLGRTIRRCDAAGGERRSWDVPDDIGSMALCESGGAVLSLRDGFYRFDFETGEAVKIADPDPGKPRIRMNDGKVDREGRFVAGYMDYEERDPLCGLYRLGAANRVERLDGDIICSNGPCWSGDGRTFYFADSFRRTVFAYDYAGGDGSPLANKRVFADFATLGLDGFPDGATVDADDHVWSVEVFRGRLVRLRPDGTVERTVGLPVTSTTSISFGGADLDIAFITSMARPIAGVAPSEREAGGLFAVRGLGVRGRPEPRFRG